MSRKQAPKPTISRKDITVNFKPFDRTNGGAAGYGSICIANAFVINFKLMPYKDSYFISYPSVYNKSKDSYYNQAYCMHSSINDYIVDECLKQLNVNAMQDDEDLPF